MGYSKAVEMEMEMGMEMASAECNYQSGRFAQAASILEKCENNNDLQSDHTNNKSSDPSNNGSKNGNRLGMNNEKSNENSAIHPSDNAHIDNNNDIIIYDESSESDNRTTSDTRFQRHQNSIAKKPNSTTTRIELLALPSSARRADIAMCRFRSALSSPTSSPTSSLWEQAIRSNQNYRMALGGAAISLTDTCREIYHAMKNKYLHCEGDIRSVQISMRETSMAILMAGVSASFLYLHSCQFENQERGHHHEQKQQQQREKKMQSRQNTPSQHHDSNASKSWKVLVDAAILAAELMSFRENFMEDVKSIDGMDNDDQGEEALKEKEKQRENKKHPHKTAKESLTPKRLSPLEEALDILNKSLLNRHENYSESKNAINGDCEREEVALHSFRTALKVSALANDRLILSTLHDDCLESSSAFPAGSVKKKKAKTMSHDADVRLSKRQKAVSGAEKRDGSESVWDVKFSHHGDASLRSREHLVDALSYHVASVRYSDDNGNKGKDDSRHSNIYLTKKKAMIENRDKCFQEADAWESRLLGTTTPVCHDADGMHDVEVGESGGYVGYAWKIKHCLDGLELASSLRFDTTLISLDETSPQSSMPKDKETFHALKQLARSSSSEFSRSLLGCIHALQGEFTSAVSSMQKVLDACERRNSTSDNDGAVRYADFDSDEEIDIGSVERRTVVNMAMCFTALGEVNTPVELLLHLLTPDTDSSISNTGRHVIPTSMLLSADGYEKETLCYGSDIVKKKSIKFKLLWMLFHASSLAKEWATCLDSMEELNEMDLISGNASFHRDIALVFALLQCRRASTAHDITTKIIPKMISLAVLTPIGNEASPYESVSMRILLLLADLYSVDACLIQDNFSKNKYYDATSSTSISFSPCECTKRAVENIDFISSSNSDMMKYPTIKELRVAVLNDRGISLLMSGDSIGALGCFRDAVAMTSSNPSISWLALPAHFNLSLLLLRDGRIEESCKSWLRARGHLPTLESAMQGNNLDLQKLRDIRLLAINRHGLLMARRNFSGDGMVLEQENVMEWVPPNLVGDELKEDDNHHYGVDVSQITALDVVLLRFAVSYAEKTAARVFRKNGGGVF